MKFIADFHIHSHFSRATSRDLTPEYLDYWAKIKGIQVLGTGDCIHPGWFNELKQKLEPAGAGLYQLKKEFRLPALSPKTQTQDVLFVLSTEISTIYKKNDKTRKVHHLIVLTNFEAAEKLQARLEKIGNIASDGRPILGLDSKILLELAMEADPSVLFIPAHIWTPWFSVLGSKSGFDRIDECFEDLTKHIFAVETGLSSDPPMNRVCSFLDGFRLVSNSDAHSPSNLGREANLFDTELSYQAMYDALKYDRGFLGTIEFFSQEGKYHYDGHRNCGICWDPLQTIEHGGICPVCNKPVTKGVMYRVAELADKSHQNIDLKNQIHYSMTALPQLLSEIAGTKSTASNKIQHEYQNLIRKLGSEFDIMLFSDTTDIREQGHELLSMGIQRLRDGRVYIQEGFDGEYGKIRVFTDEELRFAFGNPLFAMNASVKPLERTETKTSIEFDIPKFKELLGHARSGTETVIEEKQPALKVSTADQEEAISHFEGPCMVLAGPGSGKTRILTERILRLIGEKQVPKSEILALTFSNKAAQEIKTRLKGDFQVSTFHALGLSLLMANASLIERTSPFNIVSPTEQSRIVKKIFPDKTAGELKKILSAIGFYKQGIETRDQVDETHGQVDETHGRASLRVYQAALQQCNSVDLDDLIFLTVELLQNNPEILASYRAKFQWILVDECQDINRKQFDLIRLLAGVDGSNPNLCVIGDPDQAIYGFRGSDARLMMKLRECYPKMKQLLLRESFRCPGTILKAAGQVLEKTDYLAGKSVELKLEINACATDKSEAEFIASQIEKMMGGVRSFSMDSGVSDGAGFDGITSFSDIAVLCRTSALFEPIIKAFRDHGIFYQVVGAEPFYMEEPYKAVLDHLKEMTLGQTSSEQTSLSQALLPLLGYYGLSEGDQKRLLELVKPYGNRSDLFFQEILLRSSADEFDSKKEAVSLMTLHAAKGLEFKAVFIPACEEGILPFDLFGELDDAALLEEARLFYVGLTRTQQYLYLSYAHKRFILHRLLQAPKSRFLERVEPSLVSFSELLSKKPIQNQVEQLSLF